MSKTTPAPASVPPAPAPAAVAQPPSPLLLTLLQQRGTHQQALTDDDIRAYLAHHLKRLKPTP